MGYIPGLYSYIYCTSYGVLYVPSFSNCQVDSKVIQYTLCTEYIHPWMDTSFKILSGGQIA